MLPIIITILFISTKI